MSRPRVNKSRGPKGVLTEHNYRRKALPYLLAEFQKRCAYCLESGEFRQANQSHVEHFDCSLKGRRRNQYSNLMLACSGCNLSKWAKPVQNPFSNAQRLLNCTKENEFPQHIVENDDSTWIARTAPGYYHIESINLNDRSHIRKRKMRRTLLNSVVTLNKTAIQYTGQNAIESHQRVMEVIRSVINELRDSIPLPTGAGLLESEEFLSANNVNVP